MGFAWGVEMAWNGGVAVIRLFIFGWFSLGRGSGVRVYFSNVEGELVVGVHWEVSVCIDCVFVGLKGGKCV